MTAKRWQIGINGTALVLSGILLYLMAEQMVAPLIGLAVLLVLLLGPLLVPCKAISLLPKKRRPASFYSTPNK